MAYEPPDWGQPLRLKEVRQAYVAVCGFLDRCTSVREAPKGGSLTIHERGRFSPPNYHHEPFVAAATAAFGSGDRQLGVQMFPDTGYTEYKHEWRIPSTGIERAIDLVATCPRSGPEDVPPMSFFLAWRFRLRDPRTGEALPSIGRESWLHLSLTTSPSAGFDLNFPFERPDAQFLEYLHLLRPHLPIRLAKSRFRHLTPTGDGTSYVRRKIEAGLFDGL